MNIERRLEKLEQRLLPMKPFVLIYAPSEGMAADETEAFIATELAARGEPEDANIIFVTFVSPAANAAPAHDNPADHAANGGTH